VTVVVDANLVVVLTTRDSRRPHVAALFASWQDSGETLHAPSLLRYEVANALTGLSAAGRVSTELAVEAWTAAAALPIVLHDLVDGAAVIELAGRLARRSAYDAAYIALAVALGAELWTLDGSLARNAHSSALPVRLVDTADAKPGREPEA
jgi:predicted nucleic acid-binding protein